MRVRQRTPSPSPITPCDGDLSYQSTEITPASKDREYPLDYSHMRPTDSSRSSAHRMSTISDASLSGQNEKLPTPLPYLKLLPLLVSRVSEGLNYAVIFPYINQMILSFDVPESSVGVWSATAESSLMVTETLMAPIYAPISDRLGRRAVFLPLVMLFGVFAIGFGFASSVWSVILLRACLGLLAGCGVLSRTMVTEMCDRSNLIRGFALFSPSITVGVTLAPLIGGFLSTPVPRLLPPSATLFSEFPYLLPALVVGSTGVLAAVIGVAFLPETLPMAMRKARALENAEKRSGGVGALLRYQPFQNVLFLYGISQAVQYSWDAVFPLFAFTSKDLGGLGLPTQSIGVILALSALGSILMTIFLFPVLHRTIPENLYLRICLTAYPLAVLLYPIMWSLNSPTIKEGLNLHTWIALIVQMFLRRFGDFAQTMLDAIILDSIPGPEHLATANSLTFSMAAAGRAIGPFLMGWVFSISTTFAKPLSIGGQLVWVAFVLLSLPSIYFAHRMRGDSRGERGGQAEVEGEEEERYELLAGPRGSLD